MADTTILSAPAAGGTVPLKLFDVGGGAYAFGHVEVLFDSAGVGFTLAGRAISKAFTYDGNGNPTVEIQTVVISGVTRQKTITSVWTGDYKSSQTETAWVVQ